MRRKVVSVGIRMRTMMRIIEEVWIVVLDLGHLGCGWFHSPDKAAVTPNVFPIPFGFTGGGYDQLFETVRKRKRAGPLRSKRNVHWTDKQRINVLHNLLDEVGVLVEIFGDRSVECMQCLIEVAGLLGLGAFIVLFIDIGIALLRISGSVVRPPLEFGVPLAWCIASGPWHIGIRFNFR